MAAPAEKFGEDNPLWRAVLTGEHSPLRRGRRLFKLISPWAAERCRFCLAPFTGLAAPLMRALGRGPWARNPHFCDRCESMFRQHRGGTELDLAVLYADVRGSTRLAARLGPAAFGALMQRFYLAATKVFGASDAIVDKMVGDEVIGLYLPALSGADYKRRAALAGRELLRATGHGAPEGPWLPIGVGVHAGRAFVGSLGVTGGAYEFAALGDTMNRGARFVAAAKAGELVLSEAVWPEVADEIRAEKRSLKLKGIAKPVTARVARIGG